MFRSIWASQRWLTDREMIFCFPPLLEVSFNASSSFPRSLVPQRESVFLFIGNGFLDEEPTIATHVTPPDFWILEKWELIYFIIILLQVFVVIPSSLWGGGTFPSSKPVLKITRILFFLANSLIIHFFMVIHIFRQLQQMTDLQAHWISAPARV